MMVRQIINKIIFLMAIVALLGLNNNAFAVNKISIDVSGDDNRMFNEESVYPGWSKKKTVVVKNRSDESSADLYIDFGIDNGKTLADELKVYVISSSGKYKVGGSGDKYTLKEADKKGALFVDRLDPGERKKYTIKIKFDKDAGNDTQRKSTKFDVDFTLEGEVAGDLTENEILALQGRVVSGEAPSDEVGNSVDESKSEQREGQSAGTEEDAGRVAGVQTCNDGWSWWAWIILILIYIAVNVLMLVNKNNPRNKKNVLFWALAFGMLILVLWYYFDSCRNYKWAPIATIITAVVSLVKNKLNLTGNKNS